MADDSMPFSPHSNALIATLAGQPFTPLPGAQDGLGISNIIGPGQAIQAAHMQDPASVRRARLQEVVALLKTRMAGQGITRQGIERLASSSGFDLLPEDHKLGVLGHHCVELELTFDPSRDDVVQHAELKLNLAGPDADSEIQEGASRLLRSSLEQKSGPQEPWGNLDGFRANLDYLGAMDRLSSNVNCFAAVRGLYETFQSIWTAEKRRLSWRSSLRHTCKGKIGMPGLDTGGKLGLSVDYWARDHERAESDPPASDHAAFNKPHPDHWRACISCEGGLPSISKSFDWLSDTVLVSSDVSAAAQTTPDDLQPAWQAVPLDEETAADSIDKLLDIPNVRFACHLYPPIFLPLNTPLLLHADAQTIEVNHDKMIAYQQVVDKSRSPDVSVSSAVTRTHRSLAIYTSDGQSKTIQHSYALYPPQPFWCYRLDKFYFNHPRQMLEKIPVLRQHAMLWTLLSKPFEGGIHAASPTVQSKTLSTTRSNGQHPPTIKVRSNRGLKRNNQASTKSKFSKQTNNSLSASNHALNVDITIETNAIPTDTPQVRLNILVPLARPPAFLNLAVDVLLNGEVAVTSTTTKLSGEEMAKQLTRVMQLSEDLGVLVEWAIARLSAF